MSLTNLYASFESSFLKGFFQSLLVLLVCSLIFTLSACGGKKEEAPVEKEVTETVAPESTKATAGDIASEVQINREKWLAHGVSGYQIEMQKICYCVPEVVRMMVFDVKDNNVQSVRYADTGEDVDPQHYGDFNTIESMFDFVEKALEKDPADLSISYDDEYGYIKELTVDFKENIADDEITVIASNMRPKQN